MEGIFGKAGVGGMMIYSGMVGQHWESGGVEVVTER